MVSQEFKRYVGCERKKQYLNPKTARKRARELGIYCYECPFCEGYHLTKVPQEMPTRKVETHGKP